MGMPGSLELLILGGICLGSVVLILVIVLVIALVVSNVKKK